MKDGKFDNLHWYLMKEVLPVGLGVVGRAKKIGLKKLLEDINIDKNSFSDLHSEGEPLANSLRDQLDQIIPGLGNPIISVDVNKEDCAYSENNDVIEDNDSLIEILDNIESKIDLLSDCLVENANKNTFEKN